VRLRCRIGLHKWVRIRETDPTLDNPSQSAEWRSVCRYCKTERGSGVLVSSVVSGAFFVAGLVLLLVAPSLLAAILIIGAMFGLLIGVAPASIERIARWLSR
jgi:hypothetical protein